MSFLLSRFIGNPVLILWFALAVFAAGVTTGGATAWTLQQWRLGTQLAHKETELATCTGTLARTLDANQAFAGVVFKQTEAIRALEAATKERDARAAAAAIEAAKQGKKIEAQGTQILNRPLPATVAGDCPALELDLDEAVRERKGRRQ